MNREAYYRRIIEYQNDIIEGLLALLIELVKEGLIRLKLESIRNMYRLRRAEYWQLLAIYDDEHSI